MASTPLRKLTLKTQPTPAIQSPIEAVPPPTVGERIRALREAKEMSQADLAEAAKMHRPDLSNLERGKRDPKLETLRRIARGLGVSLVKLVEGLD